MKPIYLILLMLSALWIIACSSSSSPTSPTSPTATGKVCIIQEGIAQNNLVCYPNTGVPYAQDSCQALAANFYNSASALHLGEITRAPDSLITSKLSSTCPSGSLRSCVLNISVQIVTVAMYDTTYQGMCNIPNAK